MSPIWGSKPRRTDRLVVGRNVALTLTLAGWLTFYLCVRVAKRRWAVTMQRVRFLFGQF
jgi:hypothetical protein